MPFEVAELANLGPGSAMAAGAAEPAEDAGQIGRIADVLTYATTGCEAAHPADEGVGHGRPHRQTVLATPGDPEPGPGGRRGRRLVGPGRLRIAFPGPGREA